METPLSAPAGSNSETLPAPAPAFLAALQKLAQSGFRSSEFWLVISAIALLIFGAVESKLPPELSAILGTALVLGYKYFRTQVKATNGDQIVDLAAQFGDAAVIGGSARASRAVLGAPPDTSVAVAGPLGEAPSGAREARALPVALAALCLLLFSGCSMFYEDGKKLAAISSNIKTLHMVSNHGTTIDAGEIDNAAIYSAAGTAGSGLLLSGGTAVATSGLFPAKVKLK